MNTAEIQHPSLKERLIATKKGIDESTQSVRNFLSEHRKSVTLAAIGVPVTLATGIGDALHPHTIDAASLLNSSEPTIHASLPASSSFNETRVLYDSTNSPVDGVTADQTPPQTPDGGKVTHYVGKERMGNGSDLTSLTPDQLAHFSQDETATVPWWINLQTAVDNTGVPAFISQDNKIREWQNKGIIGNNTIAVVRVIPNALFNPSPNDSSTEIPPIVPEVTPSKNNNKIYLNFNLREAVINNPNDDPVKSEFPILEEDVAANFAEIVEANVDALPSPIDATQVKNNILSPVAAVDIFTAAAKKTISDMEQAKNVGLKPSTRWTRLATEMQAIDAKGLSDTETKVEEREAVNEEFSVATITNPSQLQDDDGLTLDVLSSTT